ncbi:multiple sugar transport system substrate-binding protein [Amycolatopsis arida]|uniref:Multiple sugar transport system substrate-binding protein n=1 Tax=Amycolatopsis arida TaxID=587909 RepID=A0A1I5ZTR7_9PSEU|nr:extracellular solute-binding protein [Amycolatopsis arida]TDX89360.1 multiple sugar transport system substrate-binding protein [Amycolatopsis arida]SFQ59822.1 multiple sugar transport system substrate-binding protein [Amycolatopsis arida]
MTVNTSIRSVLALTAAAALTLAGCGGDSAAGGDPDRNADATEVNLVISSNAAQGGKNTAEADWIVNYVIPTFTQRMAAEGVTANVTFEPSGVDDEQYKTKLSLDMRSGAGADIVTLDGIWVGEFAQAGYIRPLTDVAGTGVDAWDGWSQIPEAVQQLGVFEGKRYGVPFGTDARVLFYNKKLFAQAGLTTEWQPRGWQDILDAAERLKTLPGVDPLQINAGTAMGEATTMQGVLPLLAGTGEPLHAEGKWLGDSAALRDVLGFYQRVYGGGLGDPQLQQEAKGRDKSFQEFAEHKIGILLESDYLWSSVIEPTEGSTPMADRDEAVGFAKIPARQPGAGLNGQDFVSMSGGGARTVNPNTDYPQQAWRLLEFMNSAEAVEALMGEARARVTQREDVNAKILAGDPLLSFISAEVLPITAYRPGLAEYPQVSQALQEATAAVLTGTSPEEAAQAYQAALERALGGADDIRAN